MSNVIWYMGLAAICVGIAAYTIYMKKDTIKVSTFIVFYLFSASITWIGEFVALGLFDSYAYKTGLFQSPWAQNLIGHLFLNTSMFPAAAIVTVGYSLRFLGHAIIALLFVFSEYIFTMLGLYEHHWWRYYMSVINIAVFLVIAKKWFYKMNRERRGATRAIVFYFVAFLLVHLATPILLLTGKQHYQLGIVNNLFVDYYLSSTIIAFIYHLILCAVFAYFVCILKKWYWKAAPFLISLTVLTIFERMNILVIHDGWKLIYYLLIQQISIAAFILLEKYTLRPN